MYLGITRNMISKFCEKIGNFLYPLQSILVENQMYKLHYLEKYTIFWYTCYHGNLSYSDFHRDLWRKLLFFIFDKLYMRYHHHIWQTVRYTFGHHPREKWCNSTTDNMGYGDFVFCGLYFAIIKTLQLFLFFMIKKNSLSKYTWFSIFIIFNLNLWSSPLPQVVEIVKGHYFHHSAEKYLGAKNYWILCRLLHNTCNFSIQNIGSFWKSLGLGGINLNITFGSLSWNQYDIISCINWLLNHFTLIHYAAFAMIALNATIKRTVTRLRLISGYW